MDPLKGVEIRIHLDVSTEVIVVIDDGHPFNPRSSDDGWTAWTRERCTACKRAGSDVGGKGHQCLEGLFAYGEPGHGWWRWSVEKGWKKTIRRSLESAGAAPATL